MHVIKLVMLYTVVFHQTDDLNIFVAMMVVFICLSHTVSHQYGDAKASTSAINVQDD